MNRAGLDERPSDVARMFDDVAARYDIMNDLLSLGQDRRWRKQVLTALDPKPGEIVLDIAECLPTRGDRLCFALTVRAPARPHRAAR